MGILSLKNLLFFARKYPVHFHKILESNEKYPTATAGNYFLFFIFIIFIFYFFYFFYFFLFFYFFIFYFFYFLLFIFFTLSKGINLTKSVFDLLNISTSITVEKLEEISHTSPAWNSLLLSFFCSSGNKRIFEEIYCQLFILFDAKFSQMNAGYMVNFFF